VQLTDNKQNTVFWKNGPSNKINRRDHIGLENSVQCFIRFGCNIIQFVLSSSAINW